MVWFAERAAILKEVEPKLLDLSKSPYGHFVVSKLISLAPKEQLPGGRGCCGRYAALPPLLRCASPPPLPCSSLPGVHCVGTRAMRWSKPAPENVNKGWS